MKAIHEKDGRGGHEESGRSPELGADKADEESAILERIAELVKKAMLTTELTS